MNGTMDGIDFNSRDHVEARLLEAQTKATSTRKQVDSDRSFQVDYPAFRMSLPFFRRLVDRNLSRRSQKGANLRLQPSSGFCLTLPDSQDSPSGISQSPSVSRVFQTISLQFRQPELGSGFRGTSNSTTMSMPKTAVYENNLPTGWEDNVGSSG
jgi:hypothetical protein